MANIKAFKALRYNTEKIDNLSLVTAPPYDIISEDEQKDYYESNPYNVIRLEYGNTYPTDNEADNRYTRSAEFLKQWIDSGILKKDDTDAIYLYQQKFTVNNVETTCRGFIGLVELEEFSKGVVLPHEETLSKAKTDRFNLMDKTHCNFSQIYCLYLDQERSLRSIIDGVCQRKCDICFTAKDGVEQSLWIITDNNIIEKIRENFANKQLFIADGHHRYETALNFRNKLRQENPNWSKDNLFNYVMMLLVDMDDEGLVVFPTHRMVKGLNSFNEVSLISTLKDNFEINRIIVEKDINILSDTAEKDLNSIKDKNAFILYCGGDYYYRLRLKDLSVMQDYLPDKSEAYKGLDVSVLHTLILEKIMGIDKENMANQKNLIYTRDTKEAFEMVYNNECQCSFILKSTKVHEIKDVSLAEEKMPQKSTYFYPKAITGLVMNKF